MSTRSSSLNNTTATAMAREIASKYDVVKAVSEALPDIEIVATTDTESLIAAINEAKNFTGITVVAGETASWNAETKVLTIPTLQGVQGEQGEQGIQGEVGPTGARGAKGDAGPQGEQGIQGAPGQRGVQGIQGEKGDKGNTGPQGIKGDIGPVGPRGLTGADGEDGENGSGVHHLKATGTTDLEGDFSTFGELDTYTFYADADETLPLGYFVIRNGITENETEGLGIMRRSTYDIDNTGIVDNSEALGGKSLAQIEAEQTAAIQAAKLALGTNYTVADNTARLALTDLTVSDKVFVQDDGDGKWAQYWVTGVTDGQGSTSTFEVAMDEDTYLNANTAAGIKSTYESNADTNAYTDAEKTKLAGIESGATADQTATEIVSLYEGTANTNKYTDAEKQLVDVATSLDTTAVTLPGAVNEVHGELNSVESRVTTTENELDAHIANDGSDHSFIDQDVTTTSTPTFAGIVTAGLVDGRDLSVDGAKLDTVEENAKDDQVASEVPVTPAGTLTSTDVQSALEEVNSDVDLHLADLENPHEVTKAQVGLSEVDNTSDANKNVLSATKLTTPRNVQVSGAVTGTASFDGSADINITTTNTADPTITLSGDATGAVTLTNLENGTLEVTVVDDSHNHVVSNVDGLQDALDTKLESVVSGVGIAVNNTDTLNPIISIVPGTSAGILNRLHATGDTVTLSSGTYYDVSATGSGTVGTVIQSVSVGDNQKAYFGTDFITAQAPEDTVYYAGTYSGFINVRTDDSSEEQRFTVETYLADSNGNVIDSGIPSESVGDLGVKPITVMSTGIVDLTEYNEVSLPVDAYLTENFNVVAGQRVRFHVAGEKVGTGGGTFELSLYTGSERNSYVDVPVAVNSDTVLNKSTVVGATVSDVLDSLQNQADSLVSGLADEVTDRETGDTTTLADAKSYTDTAVANLVDSSPATLDTLNELAAALGDDPNFATTVSTQIGTKLDATANAVSASKLNTARTITLSGDVAGSVSFDGSGDVNITAVVADDSHNHVIANVDGLQTALDGKVDDSQVLTNVPAGAVFTDTVYTHPSTHPATMVTTSDEFVYSDSSNVQDVLDDLDQAIADINAKDPIITLTGDVSGSGTMTDLGNVSITATVADDSHNHVIANVDGLQTELDNRATRTESENFAISMAIALG